MIWLNSCFIEDARYEYRLGRRFQVNVFYNICLALASFFSGRCWAWVWVLARRSWGARLRPYMAYGGSVTYFLALASAALFSGISMECSIASRNQPLGPYLLSTWTIGESVVSHGVSTSLYKPKPHNLRAPNCQQRVHDLSRSIRWFINLVT